MLTRNMNQPEYEGLTGIQPAQGERRKAKNWQLWDSNPGCLTVAAINH